MKIPFQSILVLSHVVKHGDIKDAADELCTTISNVNFHLKKIDSQLSEPVLFKCDGKLQVKPKYIELIQSLSNKMAGIESDFSQLINAKPSINLCADISFNILYLEKKIRSFIQDSNEYQINILAKGLMEGESYSNADIVITYDDSLTMFKHRIALVKERFFFAASKEYLRKSAPITCLTDLNGHSFIDGTLRLKGDSYPKIRTDFPDIEGDFVHYDLSYPAIESAKFGNGICYASELLLSQYILSGDLVYLDIDVQGRELGRSMYFNDSHYQFADKFSQLFNQSLTALTK